MPATNARKSSRDWVLGVDGCRAGWVAVSMRLGTSKAPKIEVFPSFQSLVSKWQERAQTIIVDMPIGLVDRGRRACEKLARAKLGRGRASSVFAAPRRPMLGFQEYIDANNWGKHQGIEDGGGLSKQAWNILPKIREIDDCIEPVDQSRLGEGHPELVFYRLNGEQPCLASKRKPAGLAERKSILKSHGMGEVDALFDKVHTTHRSDVRRDDVYDACALALTAKARVENHALRLSDNARDTRGLVMEIWG